MTVSSSAEQILGVVPLVASLLEKVASLQLPQPVPRLVSSVQASVRMMVTADGEEIEDAVKVEVLLQTCC